MRSHPQVFLVLAVKLCLSASAQDTQVQYLSGHGKDDAVPWKFMCTSGANSGVWTNLPVPSHWDMHGFGTLNYKKDATNALDERGLYEHEFTVPSAWTNQRVFLVFEGAMTDTSAKINGQSVGPTHQGSFYRFKYEVTRLVKVGETNRLEVAVAKHSADDSVNRAERLADYWVFGGIFRPVYLEAVPLQFIERVAVDARHDGAFRMDVFVNGAINGATLEAQIMTLDGKPVGQPVAAGILPAVEGGLRPPGPALERPGSLESADTAPPGATPGSTAGKLPAATIRTSIASPLTWTAETPNLYSVEVRLKHGDQVLHRFKQRFGFRTMEVRDGDGLYVNGRRVILKGVNRHSFWPESGRCLSEAVHRLDIETMKDMNMNAVRMSHYPPDAQFLDLCDELGLYVLDELAGWHNKYDTGIGTRLVEEMVTRDVNHPSILFWDNGNEGGFNLNLDSIFGRFDPQQRRVLHPWASFSGICTAHYLAYSNAQIAATGQSVYYNGQESVATNDRTKYIYMPTEFMHALYDGGGGAGLEDYWNMMSASPLLGGGFIWALTDDAVKRPDTGEMDAAGNQAPDGVVGPYRQREGSFYTIKELWSPIQVRRETNGTFAVENHYSFVDAKQCKFTWQLRKFAGPQSTDPVRIVREGTLKMDSIPPGGKWAFTLPLDERSEVFDAVAVRVDDPSGRELWTWCWPMAKAGNLSRLLNVPAPQKTAAARTTGNFEIKAGDLNIRIGRSSGMLEHVSRGDQVYSLRNGPRLPGPGGAPTSITAEQDGPDYVVSAKFSGDLKSLLWRVCGNGWVQCEFKYSATGTKDVLGVLFDYPEENVKSKRWLGNGPYRVWKNRMPGGSFGVWENGYNNTVTGFREWVYPEFKGFFADVRWLRLQTSEGPITIVPDARIPFVQVLALEQPPNSLVANTKVTVPQAGLALLHGIPAIGTKFKAPIFSGPQSQAYDASGEYSGAVSFYFGELPAIQ